jgi:hypothetical protein
MKPTSCRVLFSVASLAVLVLGSWPTMAAEEMPTVRDLENARRCAAETRAAGHAFAEVRDSVRGGGTTRAEALLAVAEAALREARSACAADADVTAQLELLAHEAAGLRRSLPRPRD